MKKHDIVGNVCDILARWPELSTRHHDVVWKSNPPATNSRENMKKLAEMIFTPHFDNMTSIPSVLVVHHRAVDSLFLNATVDP